MKTFLVSLLAIMLLTSCSIYKKLNYKYKFKPGVCLSTIDRNPPERMNLIISEAKDYGFDFLVWDPKSEAPRKGYIRYEEADKASFLAPVDCHSSQLKALEEYQKNPEVFTKEKDEEEDK